MQNKGDEFPATMRQMLGGLCYKSGESIGLSFCRSTAMGAGGSGGDHAGLASKAGLWEAQAPSLVWLGVERPADGASARRQAENPRDAGGHSRSQRGRQIVSRRSQ
jgi:hypothetical protein